MIPPLTAQISRDKVGVTLYCLELNIHTCAKTEEEARRKFIDAIFEYWHFLQAHDFKNESPYKEHLRLLTDQVLPALADASLRSPHRPPSLIDKLAKLLSRRERAWDADIFGSLVRLSVP